MKVLENSNAEKKRLLEVSDRYKNEIESEINSISEKTEKVVTNALFIGGALALTYLAVTGFKSAKKKKFKKRKQEVDEEEDDDESIQPTEPSVMSQIGEAVITQATMMLLEFAKDKLSEYLHRRPSTDEDSWNAWRKKQAR